MSDSLAKEEGERQEIRDENGQNVAGGKEENSCRVEQTSNEMPDTLNKEEELEVEQRTTNDKEDRNIYEVNTACKASHEEEGEKQEIKDGDIKKTTLEEEERKLAGGNNKMSKDTNKSEKQETQIEDKLTQKATQQKQERKHDTVQASNELSDSSEMSGTVSESSQSDSGRLSPTLFLPEARVRLPKKAIDEANISKKKKEKRKLKLSEMDPEDLILRASGKGRFDLVEYSLNKNGSLHECQDPDGYTPLHRASYGGHLEIVKLLVSRGANFGARTIDGWEPLHSACRWGQKDVALYLLENGANINAKTNGNQTPLHLAALGINGSETLELLLANKLLDRTIRNNQEETAEDVAKRCGKWVELFKT